MEPTNTGPTAPTTEPGAPEATKTDAGTLTDEQIQELANKDPRFQSVLDQRVAQALKTREATLKQQFDQQLQAKQAEALAQGGEYKQLADQYAEQLKDQETKRLNAELRAETIAKFQEMGITEFAAVFDLDFSTLDGRKTFGEKIKDFIKDGVETEVKKRLQTAPPPSGGTPPPTGDLLAQIAEAQKKGDWDKVLKLQRLVKLSPTPAK